MGRARLARQIRLIGADSPAPMLVVGPSARLRAEGTSDSPAGPVFVCVDGTHATDVVVAAAASWCETLHAGACLLTVLEPDPDQALAAARELQAARYLGTLATRLLGDADGIDWEVLRGRRPAAAVAGYLAGRTGGMVVAPFAPRAAHAR